MGFSFTDRQTKVLNARNHNVLVSAAAGSGKTAVLVERIVRMISEGDHPIDVDRLLVVTFTRAAAAQMRERIGKAISDRLLQDPSNRNLQRQETLLHHAQITTIDSFCTFLLRNNFSDIDLDPGFRQMDETEAQLLEQDVMEAFLEKLYAKYQDPGEDLLEEAARFRHLVDRFCTGLGDKELPELIFTLYRASNSHPSQRGFLLSHQKDYDIESAEELLGTDWMKSLMKSAIEDLVRIEKEYNTMLSICRESDGPAVYESSLQEEIDGIRAPFGIVDPEGEITKAYEKLSRGMNEAEAFSLYQKLSLSTGISFGRLKTVTAKMEVDPLKKSAVTTRRDKIKKELPGLHKKYFAFDVNTEVKRMQECSEDLKMLISLTLSYIDELDAAKKEKNVIDFSDLERHALHIMLEEHTDENGTYYKPRPAAASYRSYFDEILIDEYQDSNEVQELLLSTIAGEWGSDEKRYARFMVGDVKQSIYRFRNARPEIFVEKYDTYGEDDPLTERIDLDQNFRSRNEVLDSVNEVFLKIMHREVGGVEYDEKVTLKHGATYPAPMSKNDYKTELLLIETEEETNDDAQGGEKEGEESLSARKQEALAIAQRIQHMVGAQGADPFFVTDEESGQLRRAMYKDIVILLRAQSSWDSALQEIFEQAGVPIFIEHKTGYFAAEEIREAMQMLRILDNPRQDIPLYGAMHGYFGKFTEEEISLIRAAGNEKAKQQDESEQSSEWSFDLYDALRFCARWDETENETELPDFIGAVLQEKCKAFMTYIVNIRNKVATSSIHEILQELLLESGYATYESALPGGKQRAANLQFLLDKAISFERTNYTGLFQFIRYIDQMRQYSVDFGEANILDERADVVRVMTIHKSKGLEFPICFVAGLGTKFNLRDASKSLLVDDDMGIGVDYMDLTYRSQVSTVRKQAIASKIKRDSIGEELRVLYVAMTRAKEKLILTANVKKAEEIRDELMEFSGDVRISAAGTFLDLFRMSGPLRTIEAKIVYVKATALEALEGQLRLAERKSLLTEMINKGYSELPLPLLAEKLEEKFRYRYPHEDLKGLYTKTTVTEVKRASLAELFGQENEALGLEENADLALREEGVMLFSEQEEEPDYVPRFIRESKDETKGEPEPLRGAAWGTAVHKICSLIDFAVWSDPKSLTYREVQEWLDGLLSTGKIPPSYESVTKAGIFLPLLHSDLAARMAKGAKHHTLFCEQPFVIEIPAGRLNPEFPNTENVLIQGIVDAFFVETKEDGTKKIVVVDYKTDRVESGDELITRYKIQLDLYAEALTAMLQIHDVEKQIYSFALKTTIEMN